MGKIWWWFELAAVVVFYATTGMITWKYYPYSHELTGEKRIYRRVKNVFFLPWLLDFLFGACLDTFYMGDEFLGVVEHG